MRHTEDIYLAGDLDAVIHAAEEYLGLVEVVPEKSVEIDSGALKLNELLARARQGLDHFGNPAGWAPRLAFEVNLAAFRREVEQSIRLFHLTYWLNHHWDNEERRIAGSRQAAEEARSRIKQAGEEIGISYQALTGLNGEIAIVARDMESTHAELADIERTLMARAEAAVRGPEWKRLLHSAATIASLVPIGQPALGSVGVALGSVAAFDPDQPVSSFLTLKRGLQGIDPSVKSNITRDLKTRLDKLKLDEREHIESYLTENKTQYDELRKAFNDIHDKIRQSQTPQNAVDVELSRLKTSDPEFHGVAQRLQSLNTRKSSLAQRIDNVTRTIARANADISSDMSALDTL